MLWEKLGDLDLSLPPSTEDPFYMNDILNRVLPHPGANTTSIHNEEHDHIFNAAASEAGRAAALRALGWSSGQMPSKKELKLHTLLRAEHECAEHLYDHGLTPGQWCDSCQCICAPAIDDYVLSRAEQPPHGDTDDSDMYDDDLALSDDADCMSCTPAD